MEEKRKIRMPIGAAVACLLIVALLTVGIVAGARFINNSLSASQTEKNASVQATSAPSGSNGTVGSSGDKTGDLPSDKISYAGSSVRPDPEYKTIENCMSSVVSIDVTAQSGHKSVLAGSGSGVIISADGYIVTCNHVVEGAQKIFVYLDNGNDYEATLVGTLRLSKSMPTISLTPNSAIPQRSASVKTCLQSATHSASFPTHTHAVPSAALTGALPLTT